MSFNMANKQFKNGDTLDSTQIYDGTQNKKLNTILSTIPICGANGLSKNIELRDLDTVRESGFYYGNEVKNAPYNWGYLLVICHHSVFNYCIQIFIASSPSNKNIYMRKCSDDVWSDWITFTGN